MNSVKVRRRNDTRGDDIIYYNYNYYIKGGCAYTEDHVLVYKVFVYKIPHNIKTPELGNYFSQFGKVLHVHLLADKHRSRNHTAPKVGFVYFQQPEAAAKVLKYKHVLMNTHILVKACDSWHQPGANLAIDCNIPSLNSNRSGTSQSSSTKINNDCILILNDYCLENIMSRLNLRDQVRFARTCQRFREVFQMASKVLHKTLHLDRLDKMTLWEIRDFFDYAGEHIKCVKGEFPEKYRERIVEFIGMHCHHIEDMNLETTDLRQKTINKLFTCLPLLKHLRLHYCSLNDSSLLPLRKLKELKTLILTDNFDLTGKHLSTLSPTIEILTLKSCCLIEGGQIISFCKTLTNLKELDLEQCYRISNNVFECMIKNCLNLETVKLSASHADYELIAKLPKLKSLTLFTTTAHNVVRPKFFTNLIEFKSEQLEYLHLVGKNIVDDAIAKRISLLRGLRTLICPFNEGLTEVGLEMLGNLINLEEIVVKDCYNVNDIGLLRLVIKCPKLKYVYVQRCTLVSDVLIIDAIKKMRQQIRNKTFKRKVPVEFFVDNTKVTEFILNDPEYVAASDLVRVNFKSNSATSSKYDNLYIPYTYNNEEIFDFEPPEIDDFYDDDDDLGYSDDELYHIFDDDGDFEYWDHDGVDNIIDGHIQDNHILFFIN